MGLPPTGELDLGFTSVTLPGTTDAPFVSRFDPDGNHQWTRAFVGTDDGPRAEQLVIAPAGEDLIVAIFTYALEPTLSVSGEQVLLGGTVSPTDGAVIVSRLTSAGTLGWSVTFPGARRLGLTASDDKLFFIDMGGPLLGGCELAVGADPILALDMSTGACAYRVMPSDARGIAPDGRGGLWVVRQGSGDPPRCNDYLEHYDSTGTVTWTDSSVTKGIPRPNDPFGCPRVDFVGPGVNGSVIVARSYPRNKDPDHTRKAPFTETRLDGSPGCYDHYQERAAGIYYFPDNYTTSVVVAPDNRAYTASVYGPFTKLRGPQQLCETAATMKGLPENPILCAHRERFEEVRVSDRLPSGGIAFHGSLGKGWLYKGPSNQCDTSAALQGPVAFFGVLAP